MSVTLAEIPEDFSGQMFCPVCCSVTDVLKEDLEDIAPLAGGEPAATAVIVCDTCSTRFAIEIEPAKVAEHAMTG